MTIIKEIPEDLMVYCLVIISSHNSAYNSMNNAGVNMSNVEFILDTTNSYWTKDYLTDSPHCYKPPKIPYKQTSIDDFQASICALLSQLVRYHLNSNNLSFINL